MVIEKGNIYLCKKDVVKNGQTLFHKGVKYRCISDNVLIGTSGISYYTTSLNPDFYFTYIGPIPKDEAFIKSSENAPIDNINHPTELWRTIEEFPNYEVSNFARVRNKITGLIKIASLGKRGYPILSFKKDGVPYTRTLHRVFATAWIPNPENKREINHINGDKCDCSFNNLEWATPFENMQHARKTGLHSSDGDKAVWQLKNGEVIAVYKSCSEAARITGYSRSNISSCARGNTRLKTYKGYEWKYRFE